MVQGSFQKLETLLIPLQQRGVQISRIFDIGANIGKWSEGLLGIIPSAEFFLFEANPAHQQILESNWKNVFIGPLSDTERVVDFYQANGTGDSYYKEVTSHYQFTEPQKMIARPLNSYDLPKPDFIKIDTQGSELDILKGAGKYTADCSLILLELPVIEYNRGAPDIRDYLLKMEEEHFVPVDVIETHYIDFRLCQLDILFMSRKLHSKLMRSPLRFS